MELSQVFVFLPLGVFPVCLQLNGLCFESEQSVYFIRRTWTSFYLYLSLWCAHDEVYVLNNVLEALQSCSYQLPFLYFFWVVFCVVYWLLGSHHENYLLSFFVINNKFDPLSVKTELIYFQMCLNDFSVFTLIIHIISMLLGHCSPNLL